MNEILTEFCTYLEYKGYCKFIDSNAVINDFIKSMQYQAPKAGSKFFPRTLNYPFEGNINISFFALEQILSSSVEIGIENYLIKSGEKKEYISQAAAHRKYGRRTIERWNRDGKIVPVKQNGLIKYKISILEKLSLANELYSKFME